VEDITDELFTEFDLSAPPQDDDPDIKKKTLRLGRLFKAYGETILKLARNRWYVETNCNLLDLADDMTRFPTIQAVAVVNNGIVIGIIARQELFDMLGRPFGREIVSKETVERVATLMEPISSDMNIISVAEDIRNFDDPTGVRYFPLKNPDGEFAGIFSTQDLLLYLSDITRKDILLARAVQTRLVKESVTFDQPGFEVITSSVQAKGVGGDFCWINGYAPGHWLMTVCDVSGKGMAASLVTCALWGSLVSFDLRRGLSRLLKDLNQFLLRTFEMEKFVTGVFVDYDENTGSMLLADMGHGYAYLFRDGRLLKMRTPDRSFPLGIYEKLDPELYKYDLLPGDLLILMTDGIIEQVNSSGENYGLGRVKKVLDLNRALPLEELRQKLLDDFHGFRTGSPLHDDITFLLLRKK